MKHVLTIAIGVLAFSLAWSSWHLYIDHQNFHAMLRGHQELVDWANRQAQQRQAAKTLAPVMEKKK